MSELRKKARKKTIGTKEEKQKTPPRKTESSLEVFGKLVDSLCDQR